MPQALRRSGSGSDAGAPLCRALQEEEHGGRHRHAPESGFRRRQGVSGIRPRLRHPVHRLHRAHHAPRDVDARAGCPHCLSFMEHLVRIRISTRLPEVFPSGPSGGQRFPLTPARRACRTFPPAPRHGARRVCPEGTASFLPSGVFGEGVS